MTKEIAYKTAENFLQMVFANDLVACANISCAVAEKDDETMIKALESVANFATELKCVIKKDE